MSEGADIDLREAPERGGGSELEELTEEERRETVVEIGTAGESSEPSPPSDADEDEQC